MKECDETPKSEAANHSTKFLAKAEKLASMHKIKGEKMATRHEVKSGEKKSPKRKR